MPRKLRTFVTSSGFFDLAIAARSMKAALEAWGTKTNLFRQGFAKEIADPDIVAATLAKPGLVLRRPVGSTQPFKQNARLPTPRTRDSVVSHTPKRTDDRNESKAALEERAREKENADLEKVKRRRAKAIADAQSALERAVLRHQAKVRKLEAKRDEIKVQIQAEQEQWEKRREELERAITKQTQP